MTRAERRRMDKAKQKQENPAKYNVTRQQLLSMVKQETRQILQETKNDIYNEAVNDAMILSMVIPLEVLMRHYWKKTYVKRLPEFTNYMLEYYKKWQNGELDMDELKKDLWEYGGVRFERIGAEK